MKRTILITALLLFAVTLLPAGETANYVFVMFYGNDSEPLLTTIQVDENLKANLDHETLLLEGNGICAECDLSYYNETWAVTDAEQNIIGISKKFPVGRETSWFRVSEHDDEFAIESPGKEIDIYTYESIDEPWPKETFTLKKGQRFIFNFEGKRDKIGPEGVQFIVKRK